MLALLWQRRLPSFVVSMGTNPDPLPAALSDPVHYCMSFGYSMLCLLRCTWLTLVPRLLQSVIGIVVVKVLQSATLEKRR